MAKRVQNHGLKVVVVSPEPEWREARTAAHSGAVYYIEKTTMVEGLVGEIAVAKASGRSSRR